MAAESKFLESFLIKCYSDILNGFTVVSPPDSPPLYIKHFNFLDFYQIELKKEAYLKELESKNIKSEKEIKEQLFKSGGWTIKEEEELLGLEDYIDRLKESKKHYLRQSERDNADRLMKEEQPKIDNLKNKLNSFLSHSKEKHLDKKTTDFYIHNSYFFDDRFTVRLFNDEMIDSMGEEEFGKYIEYYNQGPGRITIDVIKQISVEDFFYGNFNLSKGVYEFLGRPLFNLTHYQSSLFSWANLFKSIFTNTEIPNEIKRQPEEILLFIESRKQIDKQVAEAPANSRKVGWTAADYKRNGVAMNTAKPQNMKF